MSKAFTREDDDLQEREEIPARASLPAGARNYLTPDGAGRLREELATLEKRRQELLAVEDESLQSELNRLEARVNDITDSLATAEVVSVPDTPEGRVCFGAYAKVKDASGMESEYRIVGVDEVDYDQGWISWLSPLARALMNHQSGQRVKVQTPVGENELTIAAVRYA